jgi:tetratricopeptide (TPR) repeat protein
MNTARILCSEAASALIQLIQKNHGELLFHQSKFDESLKCLDDVILRLKTKRHVLEILYLKAQIEEKMGNLNMAIAHYEKVSHEGNMLYIAFKSKEKITLLKD